MIKILHTSDWHLGQTFNGYDRTEEHTHFLNQLADIVAREQPDAMVVSGDVFHNYAPPVEAQHIYNEALLKIFRANGDMPIIVTAGNHDSASKLDVNKDLWRLANVHVVGSLQRKDDGAASFDSHLIKIGDKGYVMALPHIFRQNYPPAPEGEDRLAWFFQELNEYMAAHNTDGMPTVLMAHLAVRSTELNGQRIKEGADSVGGLDFVPAEYFGEAFDYVALGHIHRPQTIRGTRHRVRYSGSPVAVSYAEDYQHSVSMVTIAHGKEPKIEEIEIENAVPLVTIPEKPRPWEEALETLKQLPAEAKCYVQLNPTTENVFPIDLDQRAIDTLAAHAPGARYTNYKPNYTAERKARSDEVDITPAQLGEMTPEEVAQKYYEQRGVEHHDFDELLKQVINRMNKEEAQ